MKNFKEIAMNAFAGMVETSGVNFISGYIMPFEETSRNHWPANKTVFGLIGTCGNKVLVYRMGTRDTEILDADKCYYPKQVGDTIKVDLKHMMLTGVKNGIPQYREVDRRA